MKIKLLTKYQEHKHGEVINIDKKTGEILVRWGLAELVEEKTEDKKQKTTSANWRSKDTKLEE